MLAGSSPPSQPFFSPENVVPSRRNVLYTGVNDAAAAAETDGKHDLILPDMASAAQPGSDTCRGSLFHREDEACKIPTS
jgi:hypothetical protein